MAEFAAELRSMEGAEEGTVVQGEGSGIVDGKCAWRRGGMDKIKD